MKPSLKLCAIAISALGICGASHASDNGSNIEKKLAVSNGPTAPFELNALTTQTLGSRGVVSSTITLSGGFEIRTSGTVYLLVRGNSLRNLGITQNILDLPRVQLFDAQGRGIVLTNGLNLGSGFGQCLTGTSDDNVINFYRNVRGVPVDARDACLAINLLGGTYTFAITPSSSSFPSSGEVLFEVTLGP